MEMSDDIKAKLIEKFNRLGKVSSPIFKDRDKLTDSHTPPDIVGRDIQVSDVFAALQPMLEGSSPNNMFIHGVNGVGKTFTVKHVFKLFDVGLSASSDDTYIKLIHINCGMRNNDTDVCAYLLREFGIDFNPKGYSINTSLEKIWDYINELGKICSFVGVVFFFDEIDKLNPSKVKPKGEVSTQLDILYNITRAIETGIIKHKHCKIGLMLASNNELFFSKIQQSIVAKGFMNYKFPKYTEQELYEIMKDREEAFNKGVLSDEIIRYIAKDVAERYKGDARRALDTILFGGDIAKKANLTTIEMEHILQAESQINRLKLERSLMDYTKHEQYLLLAIDLSHRYNKEPTLGMIDSVYRKWICPFINKNPEFPVSYGENSRTITDWEKGIGIIESIRGRRGNSRIVSLYDDLSEAVQILYTDELKQSIEENESDLERIATGKDKKVYKIEKIMIQNEEKQKEKKEELHIIKNVNKSLDIYSDNKSSDY
jgi:cell division control protein 6